MNRNVIQKKAVQLIDQSNVVALKWATGAGKSKAALMMVDYISKKKITDHKLEILICVAENAHKQNWTDEIHKHGFTKLFNFTIECYASLKKYKYSSWDVIIFDEAHHLGTSLRLDIIDYIIARYTILLSATISDNKICDISDKFGTVAVDIVTLEDVIEWDILPEPEVILIPMELDNTTCDCTIVESWGSAKKRVRYECEFKDRWTYCAHRDKYPDAELTIKCTQHQKYMYLCSRVDYWRTRYIRRREEFAKNKWMLCGSERKRFIGDLKTSIAMHLVSSIKQRFICFCSSIGQANLIGGNNEVLHHKLNKGIICNRINKFNTGELNRLFAVGMLQEGQNLRNIEAGVIIQLDGKEGKFIQKLGRTLRSKEKPKVYILYYKNTVDTTYLQHVYNSVPHNCVTEAPVELFKQR